MTTKLSDLRMEVKGDPSLVCLKGGGHSRPVEVSDLVEALDGEVLKDATIRDKRGRYRNGDFIVIPVSDGGSET